MLKVDVKVTQSYSQLQDFTGLLYQDSSSNLFLNLSITGGAGLIIGELLGADQSQQSLRLVLTPELATSSHKIPVSPSVQCSGGSMVSVSLKPQNSLTDGGAVTRDIVCVSHTMRQVSQPRSVVTHDTLPGDTWQDCVTCLDTWIYWLQPLNWVDTSWPLSRVIINSVLFIIIIALIFVIVKIVRSLCCPSLVLMHLCHKNIKNIKT